MVQTYWNGIYKSNTKKNTSKFGTKKVAPVKKVAKVKRTPLVRKVRNGGLVLVKQPSKVTKVIEQAVEAKVPAPKKDMMAAALTTNKGFQLMR